MGGVTVDVWCDVLLCGGVAGFAYTLLHLLGLSCSSSFLICFSLWALAAAACVLLPTLKVSPAGKTVLITGCDTGFGFALALHLDKLGFRVVAGCLAGEGEGARKLVATASSRLTVLQLDVTSKDHLTATLARLNHIIPDGEVLWGLVNNAGVSTFGEVEWVPEDTYRRVLEVNVIGTVAASRTFLPLIRRARGRVVNVASMYGRMANTMRSPYVLSKYAVEGFTDCLRQEMRSWGVDVCLIEPGNYVAATSIFTDESVRRQGEAMWAAMGEDVRQDYTRQYFDTRVKQMMSYTNCGIQDVSTVVEALTASLTQRFPRARYLPMDPATRLRVAVATHLPEWLYDNLYTATHR